MLPSQVYTGQHEDEGDAEGRAKLGATPMYRLPGQVGDQQPQEGNPICTATAADAPSVAVISAATT